MKMKTETRLRKLRERLGAIADIQSAISLLNWDQEVCMPPKGAEARGFQLGTLSAVAHRMLVSREMGNLLAALQDEAERLDPDSAKLVSEAVYDYERARKLPERFVEAFARETSRAYEVWVKARQESRFPEFLPSLERIVELLKRRADLLGYEGSPYNALIEDHERGMTTEELERLFAELRPRQTALLERLAASGEQPEPEWVRQAWAPEAQWHLSLQIISDLGYDLEAGRQDKSVHPFTMSFDIHDVRITTRVPPNDLFSALMASIHECGHALYEQGFRSEDRRTPLAQAPSLGIHESQSRLWENMIGRSPAFWRHYLPRLRESFPGQLDKTDAEDVCRALNRVHPTLIRVDADECTYNLHIILRFEVERAVIEGTLAVADIPERWNSLVKQYLSLDVPDDASGCLQDVHWSHGAFGYFPSYALGNVYAGQLLAKIVEDIPDLWSKVEDGAFGTLLDWLRTHVHRVGRRMTGQGIVNAAMGVEPGAEQYLSYLEAKYAQIGA